MALAPPAEKDGFSYAGDAFYREASNLNRHRRATLPELKAHFSGKDIAGENNRPAHWYEAQLLHYGLPPSKVKGTAHKRLWDAVIKPGGLAVPAHIQKIETDLKKDWTKREREAKKMLKDAPAKSGASSTKGTKRKADQVSSATSVSVSVSGHGSSMVNVVVQTAQSAPKKAKTAAAAPATKAKKAAPAKSTVGASPSSSKKAPAPQATRKTSAPIDKKKTTATTTPKSVAKPPAKPKATPKKAPQAPGFDPDEAPPPYTEYDARSPGPSSSKQSQQQYHSSPPRSSKQSQQEYHSSPPRSSQQQDKKIGLLNGRYRVSCPHIEGNFPEYAGDLGLIATLDGKNLWLTFDFRIAEGMIKVPRPADYEDPEDGAQMFWRGRAMDRFGVRRLYNVDTVFRAGPVNRVYWMGGGHIRGKLSFTPPSDGYRVEFDFDAYRLPGQSWTSEVSTSDARAEWARLDENVDD